MHGIEAPTWELALREFLVHKEACERPNTARFYRVQLGQLAKWAEENDIPFDHFGKRHMDRYVAHRIESGVSERTRHHDGRTALNFFAWCLLNDLIGRNLLHGWKAPKAAKKFVYTPSRDEVDAFLVAVREYWNPEKNPGVRFEPPVNRAFHRDRNHAFYFGLANSGCRIGELCGLKLSDYDPVKRTLTFRETKGKKPRTVPVSRDFCAAMDVWLRTRRRVTKGLENDEGWAFISEFGTRLDEGRMNFIFHKVRRFAKLPHFTPHAFRHFAITNWSAIDLPAAQVMAGHEDIRTTAGYVDVTEQRMRAVHEQAGLARGGLLTRKPVERKRLL